MADLLIDRWRSQLQWWESEVDRYPLDGLRCASSVKTETYLQPLGIDRSQYNKRKDTYCYSVIHYDGNPYNTSLSALVDLL